MSYEKNPFASKVYIFLRILVDRQTLISGETVIRFSQKELADDCNACETTVNRWMRALRETGCIELKHKGKYSITPVGLEVVRMMEDIVKVIGLNET